MNEFEYMDNWNDDQINDFKEQAKENQYADIVLGSYKANFISSGKQPSLVAEGDSWFDYLPGTDIIDCLRKHHNYYIHKFAKAGDTLENMIYGTGYKDNFERTKPTIERVLKSVEQIQPKVFLFSGGGNDIAGEEFASFLSHKDSGFPSLREGYLEFMINEVFEKYLSDLYKKVIDKSPGTHIVMHGYGYTAPTGKGVKFLFFNFAGPWLRPALTMKGILESEEQNKIVNRVIDCYNDMLANLAKELDQFHHIDLRNVLTHDNWINELHLKNSAYAMVAKLFHEKISALAPFVQLK